MFSNQLVLLLLQQLIRSLISCKLPPLIKCLVVGDDTVKEPGHGGIPRSHALCASAAAQVAMGYT